MIEHISYGEWEEQQFEENNYDYEKASFGTNKSKKLGDGMWCKECKKYGIRRWLSFFKKDEDYEYFIGCETHNVGCRYLLIPRNNKITS